MPAYIHGSLAVEQRTKPKVTVKETKKIVYRNKSLPVQEKLLYLFTMLICVIVASLIIWRYAQIYEMNTKILKLETDIQILQADNSVLKHKVESLSNPDRLRQEALKLGMVPPEDKQISKVPMKSSGTQSNATASAVNDKKVETTTP
ncbi:cell division protein FtsL [Paenibacillus sp. LMG 31456]|uniref:Cell division protein FtsL n=1 Tax=Paenibacillus foliorum TaxID=2654974 RepID=A0A972K099_9BACL|nr:cell division protein FtsL [Paenibacillus foliorum]NOU95409.1 cell division protein FtsL [Paenibacillus foliorum]